MIFPFPKGIAGYDYGVKTTYNAQHLGVDWDKWYETVRVPKKSKILNISRGSKAGLAILFRPIGESTGIRWVHLEKVFVKTGDIVKEGQPICVSGNSGTNTTGAHLHEDMWKDAKVTLKFKDTINPHEYYKNMKYYFLQRGSEYILFEESDFLMPGIRIGREETLVALAKDRGMDILKSNGNIDWDKVNALTTGYITNK